MDTQPQRKFKILLIGDSCTDVYEYGTVDRISPEAPVPVFKRSHKITLPGMAANVQSNLQKLGCTVDFMHGELSIKTRLIDTRSKQQIVRIDDDTISDPLVFTDIQYKLENYHGLVISDYGKGYVTETVIEQLIQLANKLDIPVFIDTKKKDLKRFEGSWVKINEFEYSQVKSECTGLIVTRGSKGASLISQDVNFSAPVVEVADVTGAGDTFLSALCYYFLVTKNITKSISFAISASSITVQHNGVYAPDLGEIECVYMVT